MRGFERRPVDAAPLPRFKLDRELGTGTSGRVWHGVLLDAAGTAPAGTEVAVKYLHPRLEQDAAALAAFETEARAGLAARHAGLVEVLGSGRDAKGRCLVMRFVGGRSLREVLKEPGTRRHVWDEHASVVEAIAAHDPAEAADRAFRHVGTSLRIADQIPPRSSNG